MKCVHSIRGYDRRKDRGPGDSASDSPQRNVNDAARLARFSPEETESAVSLSIATSLTHCTLSRPLVVLFFFPPARRNQQQWGHKVKRQALITLWYNAPSQADSAQSVGRSTFGEVDGSHATRRGCRRSWRHPRREGRRWSTRGWHAGCHPRDILPATIYALSPRSRFPLALAPSLPCRPRNPIDLPFFPAAVPARPFPPPPFINLRPSFSRAFSLAPSIAAATTGCGIDWPSCPSSERSGRSKIRTRPTAAFFTFIAIFTCRFLFLLLLLHHLCVHLFFGARWYKLQKGIPRYCDAAAW